MKPAGNNTPLNVAQISNLLYRRLVVGRSGDDSLHSETANAPQIANLRYGPTRQGRSERGRSASAARRLQTDIGISTTVPDPSDALRTGTVRAPRESSQAPASQRGFSLLEIMVAVALLALIIVGLLAMFYQVQRAFRSGTTQVDVMEGGRAATSLIVREAQEAIAVQMEPITNMGVVVPVVDLNNNPAPSSASQQTLPGGGGDTRQNLLRDFFFLSHVNDEWVGTAYRLSNAVSGVGTLYRFVERQTTNNPWFLASNLAIATPYNNTNFRRVMDGVVHFTVDLYETNGLIITNNAYPAALGYAVTKDYMPAYIDVELALLEPAPLAKFRYRYDANPAQAASYLANQAARTHVFRQRVPIRPAPADYGQ